MTHDEASDYWTLWYEYERRQRRREPEWTGRLFQDPDVALPSAFGDLVGDYLAATAAQARRAVKTAEEEVEVRRRLHEQDIEQLNYQITEATTALERFRGWGVGYNRGIDQKRLSLERRLDTFRHEKRVSRLHLWDDMVKMRRELEARRRERDAIERRLKLR